MKTPGGIAECILVTGGLLLLVTIAGCDLFKSPDNDKNSDGSFRYEILDEADNRLYEITRSQIGETRADLGVALFGNYLIPYSMLGIDLGPRSRQPHIYLHVRYGYPPPIKKFSTLRFRLNDRREGIQFNAEKIVWEPGTYNMEEIPPEKWLDRLYEAWKVGRLGSSTSAPFFDKYPFLTSRVLDVEYYDAGILASMERRFWVTDGRLDLEVVTEDVVSGSFDINLVSIPGIDNSQPFPEDIEVTSYRLTGDFTAKFQDNVRFNPLLTFGFFPDGQPDGRPGHY